MGSQTLLTIATQPKLFFIQNVHCSVIIYISNTDVKLDPRSPQPDYIRLYILTVMWVFFSKIFKISSLYLTMPNYYRCSVITTATYTYIRYIGLLKLFKPFSWADAECTSKLIFPLKTRFLFGTFAEHYYTLVAFGQRRLLRLATMCHPDFFCVLLSLNELWTMNWASLHPSRQPVCLFF